MRLGASSSSVAKVSAMRAGPRVQVFTTPGPSLTRDVMAAIAPNTEIASRARRVSQTQTDSNPSSSARRARRNCSLRSGRSRKQRPIRSMVSYSLPEIGARSCPELAPLHLALTDNVVDRSHELSEVFVRHGRADRPHGPGRHQNPVVEE